MYAAVDFLVQGTVTGPEGIKKTLLKARSLKTVK